MLALYMLTRFVQVFTSFVYYSDVHWADTGFVTSCMNFNVCVGLEGVDMCFR